MPAPDKRRLAKQGQNGVKMTPVADDFHSSIPPSYNTAVDANGAQDKSDFDNPAYMTEQTNNDGATKFWALKQWRV